MRYDWVHRLSDGISFNNEANLSRSKTPFQEFAIAFKSLKSVKRELDAIDDNERMDVLDWDLWLRETHQQQ